MVFILFLGGTISKYLAETGQGHFVYDFRLLSGTFSTPNIKETWLRIEQALLDSSMVTP